MDVSSANIVFNPVFRPPVLDGSNYALWKVKMRIYIKSIEVRAWLRVLDGWTPPTTLDTDGDTRIKSESAWTADEVQNSNYNSKALNAIFSSVDINMFSLISNCTSAKDAWEILQKHCQGPESVRRTRLRMLTSKFESLRMEETETITEYDRRIRDIANEAFSLGDPMSNERLVSKVLRSLPERFNIKICVIDEAKDTTTFVLDDLISSLRTFEMNLDLQKKDKGTSIGLHVSNESYDDLLQISQEVNQSDLGEDSISLITNKFGDYLKKMREKKKSRQTTNLPTSVTPEKHRRVDNWKQQGKIPASETTNDKGKEHSETTQTVLESKDAENNVHSLSNGRPADHVNHIEHILASEILVEKGKEELICCQPVGTEPILDKGNMEEQFYGATNDDPSAGLCYKSMYMSSQKKIENLMAENCQLAMKLEFARGKIEAYEKMNDALRMTKDVLLMDSIRGKTNENAIGNGYSAPDEDHRYASPEKNDSKNASNIANKQNKVSQQRKKDC